MQTITIDTNETHRLALVADLADEVGNARYEPLTTDHQIDDSRVSLTYIPQYHAVANTVAIGLTAQSLGYPRDGWKRWSELKALTAVRS